MKAKLLSTGKIIDVVKNQELDAYYWVDSNTGEGYYKDEIVILNETVDFFSVHSREEIAEIDKRIERKQKEYDAELRGRMMFVKDFLMTE